MKWKWQLFLGGSIMFWLASILIVLLIFVYTITFVIDPTTSMYMDVQNTDTTSIQEMSEEYVKSLGVKINKPICYRFVQFRHEEALKYENQEKYGLKGETILLGTFHEWNGTYYIDISSNLYKMSNLHEIVRHETRHMLVQELKNENIIDLNDYTEEIAREQDEIYNNLFDCGVKLLKETQKTQ